MTAYREQLLASKGIGRSKAQALDKLMKLLGPRRLVELTTTAFLEFCRARENEGAGPATILQDLTHIGTVLRHGGALIGAEHAVETCVTALDAARRTSRHLAASQIQKSAIAGRLMMNSPSSLRIGRRTLAGQFR